MKKNDFDILDRVEAQLEALNRKLDILIKQSSQKPERSFESRRSFDDRSDRFDRSERPQQHKAVCAECGKSCDVPFKPVSGRPVFCSECFALQQEDGGEKPRFQKGPRDFKKIRPVRSSRDYKKPAPGKKPFFKKK